MTIKYILYDGLVTGNGDPEPSNGLCRLTRPARPRRVVPDVLDAVLQISLFVKLKLTNCAPMSGLSEIGFFMSARALLRLPSSAASLAPLAGRGYHSIEENQISAR
jgi:hypothetical protein